LRARPVASGPDAEMGPLLRRLSLRLAGAADGLQPLSHHAPCRTARCLHRAGDVAGRAFLAIHREAGPDAQGPAAGPARAFGAGLLTRKGRCMWIEKLWRRWTNPHNLTRIFHAREAARYGWQIGDYSYGRLRVRRWSEGGRLVIGPYCSFADNVTIFLGGN